MPQCHGASGAHFIVFTQALQRRSLDNSVLERFPQRLSVSASCLAAVVEGPDSSQSCHSCASSESGCAPADRCTLRCSGDATSREDSITSISRTSPDRESRMKLDFVLSACTGSEKSDGSGVPSGSGGRTAAPPFCSSAEMTSKISVSSFKLSVDAIDASSSPVRPAQDATASDACAGGTSDSTPLVSVCGATALMGGQMQQGVVAHPVRVLAPGAACMQPQPGDCVGMRRAISASGINQQGSQTVRSSRDRSGVPRSGLALSLIHISEPTRPY